ncbi:hypothetical protein CPB97_011415 [Podila verticillata]|nr:hypothetical protein CPB97_011415 [Podila verticillata]
MSASEISTDTPGVPEPTLAQPAPTPSPERFPRVLIVGGGLGGLTLAILLHKANIPFIVLERAKELKPLGSALVLGANMAPLFRQLGIYDEFLLLGREQVEIQMFNEELKPQFNMDFRGVRRIGGAGYFSLARADLYEFLWKQIPREYMHLGKRVLSYTQDDEGVTVNCSDNSSYCGDILVGADGAYSAIRQQLFKDLKLSSKLPSSDDVPLPFSCVCLVGQTCTLDPEEFPYLKEPLSQAHFILGDYDYTWMAFTSKKNTYCWMVIQFLNKETSKQNDAFRNSEWGPEAAEAMCKEVRHFKLPSGEDGKSLTLGDLIDKTPMDLISKVMLEEKVFDTWYGGRTVLLGDACHKMNPTGAAGALTAMHDAVTLANWINTLQSSTVSDLNKVFKEYRAERHPVAKEAFDTSKMFAKNIGKNFTAILTRFLMKRVPAWLWRRLTIQMSAARYQVSFLPLVEDKGEVKPMNQPSLHKTLAILAAQGRSRQPSVGTTIPATI